MEKKRQSIKRIKGLERGQSSRQKEVGGCPLLSKRGASYKDFKASIQTWLAVLSCLLYSFSPIIYNQCYNADVSVLPSLIIVTVCHCVSLCHLNCCISGFNLHPCLLLIPSSTLIRPQDLTHNLMVCPGYSYKWNHFHVMRKWKTKERKMWHPCFPLQCGNIFWKAYSPRLASLRYFVFPEEVYMQER